MISLKGIPRVPRIKAGDPREVLVTEAIANGPKYPYGAIYIDELRDATGLTYTAIGEILRGKGFSKPCKKGYRWVPNAE